MSTIEQQFHMIAEKLGAEDGEVSVGKMMSSPGIRYREKSFVFYHRGVMVFRLGRAFDPQAFGLHDYRLLSPFKTKPPLLDWFEIPTTHQDRWEELARLALIHMREQKR